MEDGCQVGEEKGTENKKAKEYLKHVAKKTTTKVLRTMKITLVMILGMIVLFAAFGGFSSQGMKDVASSVGNSLTGAKDMYLALKAISGENQLAKDVVEELRAEVKNPEFLGFRFVTVDGMQVITNEEGMKNPHILKGLVFQAKENGQDSVVFPWTIYRDLVEGAVIAPITSAGMVLGPETTMSWLIKRMISQGISKPWWVVENRNEIVVPLGTTEFGPMVYGEEKTLLSGLFGGPPSFKSWVDFPAQEKTLKFKADGSVDSGTKYVDEIQDFAKDKIKEAVK